MATVRDLFLALDATALPTDAGVRGFTLRLRAEDMATPGWLLRAIQAQAARGGALQILTPDGEAVAFVADPAATAALAEREPASP